MRCPETGFPCSCEVECEQQRKKREREDYMNEVERAAANFKPGLYRHYKGGLYTALFLVTHHETRLPMVLYISHTYGGANVRPLIGWQDDQDGWLDIITIPNEGAAGGESKCHRFALVGSLPSNKTIENRAKLMAGQSL
jgi:hypothetical protein